MLPCRMKEVLIIGGGIAGLGAATALLRAKCPVTLLEAKPRLGGRIHTGRGGSPPIELGAEFIHGHSPSLLSAIEAAGLSTHEVPERHRLFNDGSLERVDLWKKFGKLIRKVNTRGADRPFQEFLDRQN